MKPQSTSPVMRDLSGWLLLAMLMAPGIFVWFFLRRRYRPDMRRAAFVYAIGLSIPGLVALALG